MDAAKERITRGATQKMLANSDALDPFAKVIATSEIELLKEVAALQDALDGEHDTVDVPDPEARQEGLVEAAQAAIAGDVETYYREQYLDDHYDNPETAAEYLAMDEADWRAQIERWAQPYREGPRDLSAYTDRQLAAMHVRSTFDVSLDRFEAEVVNFHAGSLLESVFAGNLRQGIEGIRTLRREVEDGNETD